jgi:uncharacterized OB-fold protein
VTATDAEVLAAYPDAAIDHDNLEFYPGLLEHRFLINRCAECAHWHVPPQPICPSCWSREVEPTPIGGYGVVHMFVVLHQGASPPGDAAAPTPFVTVELPEQPGLRISTILVDGAADDLRIGLGVELTWLECDGAAHPVFRPAAAGSSSS